MARLELDLKGEPYDFAAAVESHKRFSRRACQPQVRALMAAGWLFVLPDGHPDPEPWQWRWRRPPKRAGRPGRLYPSTRQAYNAMERQQAGECEHA